MSAPLWSFRDVDIVIIEENRCSQSGDTMATADAADPQSHWFSPRFWILLFSGQTPWFRGRLQRCYGLQHKMPEMGGSAHFGLGGFCAASNWSPCGKILGLEYCLYVLCGSDFWFWCFDPLPLLTESWIRTSLLLLQSLKLPGLDLTDSLSTKQVQEQNKTQKE